MGFNLIPNWLSCLLIFLLIAECLAPASKSEVTFIFAAEVPKIGCGSLGLWKSFEIVP
jgi:hypothetical protein